MITPSWTASPWSVSSVSSTGPAAGACGWSIAATRDPQGESDTTFALQLVLKGLTNVGDPADRLLERGILGYESD